jgi:Chemotaxis signal transduction protein
MLYILFVLNNEEYGIEISYAQEIIRIPDKTTIIPNMPYYMDGVINLRSKVIPIIDLKRRFGFQQMERGIDSRLLILNMENEIFGIVVDDVTEIIPIDNQSIQEINQVVPKIGSNSLKGIRSMEERLVLLLDGLRLKTEIFQDLIEMEVNK